MSKKISRVSRQIDELPSAHGPRLPGFVGDPVIGLGDVVRRATSYLGFRSCEGCERRADALNRWLAFKVRRPR
jgi:hypothetical protein